MEHSSASRLSFSPTELLNRSPWAVSRTKAFFFLPQTSSPIGGRVISRTYHTFKHVGGRYKPRSVLCNSLLTASTFVSRLRTQTYHITLRRNYAQPYPGQTPDSFLAELPRLQLLSTRLGFKVTMFPRLQVTEAVTTPKATPSPYLCLTYSLRQPHHTRTF